MTTKQKLAASKLVENGGNIGKAMIAAGYSPATAKTPQKLTQSRGWQALMKKHFPDTLLAKRHNDLLNKKEYIVIGKKGEREVVPTGEIDANAVAKGLDMAYKLKSKYPNKQLDDESDQVSQEIREVVFRIRTILPKGGQ